MTEDLAMECHSVVWIEPSDLTMVSSTGLGNISRPARTKTVS